MQPAEAIAPQGGSMKPLLDVLIILDALEKEGSFAAASAKLFKTPSALSYTVHKPRSYRAPRPLYPYRANAAGERAGCTARRA